MFGVSFIQNWRTFLKVLMKHPFALHLKHTPPEDRRPVLSLAPHNLDRKYEGNPQPFLKYPRTRCISSCHVFSFFWLFNTFLHDFSRVVNTGNIVAPKHVWTQKTQPNISLDSKYNCMLTKDALKTNYILLTIFAHTFNQDYYTLVNKKI